MRIMRQLKLIEKQLLRKSSVKWSPEFSVCFERLYNGNLFKNNGLHLVSFMYLKSSMKQAYFAMVKTTFSTERLFLVKNFVEESPKFLLGRKTVCVYLFQNYRLCLKSCLFEKRYFIWYYSRLIKHLVFVIYY